MDGDSHPMHDVGPQLQHHWTHIDVPSDHQDVINGEDHYRSAQRWTTYR